MFGVNGLASMMNNPEVKRMMDLCKEKDPKEVFYDECKRKGVDPDSILSMLANKKP